MEFAAFLALLFAVPTLLYVAGRHSGRGVWGLVVRGWEERGAGAYRSAKVPVFVRGTAPFSVKVAAATSFLLGQMIVPGVFAALVGFIASLSMLGSSTEPVEPLILILTLSAPSGLWVAGGLLGAGMFLLRRDPSAAQVARRVSRLSITHNVVLVLAVTVMALLHEGPDDGVWLPVIYAFVSILQAAVLLVAAQALDERAAEEVARPDAIAQGVTVAS